MKEEKDDLTPEIILIDISNGFQKLKRLGVDRKIINDTLINSMNHEELNYLCNDLNSYLRSHTHKF